MMAAMMIVMVIVMMIVMVMAILTILTTDTLFLSLYSPQLSLARSVLPSEACSSDCAAFVHKFAWGSRCFESFVSNQEVYAYAVNQTCSDSGEQIYLCSLTCCSFVLAQM